ncbi:tellurium resistance protein [Photobacterium aquae]|uniref:Tellurium resistance protein n=1 Tax=Photobacterium aquae TaxID=1195763 RepID=A0A0J1HD95_9GAMM|nr:TDT family transporter [Photobacterium aquae]KLV09603.1 tellurium resistance protein [Photobacterium aquae]
MTTFAKALLHVPSAQAALALATTGTGLAWSLFIPSEADWIRGSFATLGALLLIPVLLKYIANRRQFLQDLRHPLHGSLMPPISMTMLILADYLTLLHVESARLLWYPALLLHFFMMGYFFFHQFRRFRLTNIYPSWFLYPVGAISGTLAGPQLGHHDFALVMTDICIAIYFLMLPVMLYRLCFAGRLPRQARPTLAIMAAPVNLALTAYLTNVSDPDPILTGALAGVGITMTILVYLCYINLLKQRFQPSLAALTFPSVISAVALDRLTEWLSRDYPQWAWLERLGIVEIAVATALVGWVGWHFICYYWHSFSARHIVSAHQP